MRQLLYSAGNATVAICSTMVTTVGKGTPRYKIKIVCVEIIAIAPSIALSTNIVKRRSWMKYEILTFCRFAASPMFFSLISSFVTSQISGK